MKEYNEQVVETLDDAGCIIANKNIIIDNLQARIAELEEENAHLKKSRENFAVHAEQTLQQLATLTRQRDLAVEALKAIAGRRIFIDNLASNVDIAVMTLDAIKESEV